MPVDTRGLHEEHVGMRLRIELPHAHVEKIDLLELTVCQEPEPCCAITHGLLGANHRDESKQAGSVYRVGFGDIKKSKVLGERLA
jgi:hypothetical protein